MKPLAPEVKRNALQLLSSPRFLGSCGGGSLFQAAGLRHILPRQSWMRALLSSPGHISISEPCVESGLGRGGLKHCEM